MRLLAVEMLANLQRERARRRDRVELAKSDRGEDFLSRRSFETRSSIGHELACHVAHALTRESMQRPAEIWKCGIPSDFGLEMDGKAFGEKPIAAGEENVDQLMEDGRLARKHAPRREFHMTSAPVPGRHQ